MPKERKVVIEEIQMNNDDASTQAYYFFSAKSMAGTAYARPVLGRKNIIASISKDRIIDYWKQFYAPNNMIGLVIGDFDTEQMIEMYQSVFGVLSPAKPPSPPVINYTAPSGKTVYSKAGETKQTYISIGVDAPHFTDPDYYAFDLMAEYLGSPENSPLAAMLVDSAGQSLYQSLSVSLETQEEFAASAGSGGKTLTLLHSS